MNTTESSYPCYDTGLGKVFIKEALIQDVVIPEVVQSSYFFPPGTMVQDMNAAKAESKMRRHISVEGTGNRVRIGVAVDVLFGIPVQNEARHLQEKVRRSVEVATGLSVEAVDLDIRGLVMSVEESPDEGEEGGAGA